MLGQPELVNDIPRRQLSMVYGALTDDMAKSLVDQPKALTAFNRATQYYKAGRNRIENFIQPLLSGPKTESTVDRLMATVKDNAKGAQALRRSATPEEWDTVAASIFHDLGKETPGTAGSTGAGFSIPKFLTDYNKLRANDKAFNLAFGGTRYAKLRDNYGDLSEIADSIKHSVKMANPSRSGYVAGATGLAASLFTNPITAMKVIGANYAMSRVFASPKMARWLVKTGKYVRQAQQGSGKAAELALRAHIAKLPAIAASDSDAAEGIGHLYQYLIGGGH
jgi:hypothetical protein